MMRHVRSAFPVFRKAEEHDMLHPMAALFWIPVAESLDKPRLRVIEGIMHGVIPSRS